MEELLKLMRALREGAEALARIYSELVEVLNHEEEIIANYSLGELERIVVEKDQLIQRISSTEQRRLSNYRRICFLIAYDARNQLPTLTEFKSIFQTYLTNIEPLVDIATLTLLREEFAEFAAASHTLQNMFREISPRVYRNQKVLKKLADHFARSIHIFESELDSSRHYDPTGRATTHVGKGDAVSFLRVKA